MSKKTLLVLLLSLVLLALAACGGGGDTTEQPPAGGEDVAAIGDAENGERLFSQATDYIHQSIVEPNAYVVEPFAEGLMYQNYGTDLTEQEINDLVAYTLTLE